MEREITFTTDEGYQYLVSFSSYKEFSIQFNVNIIDVSIILMNKEIEKNTFKTLSKFIEIISEYLIDNPDVVLYYYCDTTPINIRKNRRENLTYQEYRSKLFAKLFEKANHSNFVARNYIIEDTENGNHYITLITNIKQTEIFDKIKFELESIFNK